MTDFYASDYFFEFETKATTFSLRNALFLAKVSQAAYEDSRFLVEFKTEHDWSYPNFAFVENEAMDTEALIIGNDAQVIVAFRGTEGKIEDWLTNADYSKLSGLGGEIHAGFVKAADSVFLDIVCVLNEFCDKGQSVWFTGHSLGGALATLTTARLIANGITVNGLYTFGQPRVGDEGFAYHFNSNFSPYFRIVNDGDVVSRVPTSQMGFSHAGDFYYLTAEGALTQDKSYWEQFWQNKGRVLDDFLELAVFGLPEHSTNSYIEKLAGVLAQCQG